MMRSRLLGTRAVSRDLWRLAVRHHSSNAELKNGPKIATDDYELTNSFKTLSVQEMPIPDHSIPHSYIMGSETYGQIVRDEQYDLEDQQAKVKVVDFEQHTKAYKDAEATALEDGLTGEERRIHPDVLKGRVNRRQIKVPDIISKTINNKMLIYQDPKKLKIKASKIFVELSETGIQQPSKDSPLEVDANIASFFVQNYAEAYQVLSELFKRKPDFAPSKVLDVSYGPATGMIALNDLMGEKFAPEVKHSFVIGPYEMQKRAKVLLSRQLCEYNNLDRSDAKANKTPSGEEILEGSDLVYYDNGASHEIDTKKISIKTKLLSYVPETMQYDLIVLSHQLLTSFDAFPLEVDEVLDEYLRRLAPGGCLVVVERGSPLGFETVARARQITMRPENHVGKNSKTPRLYIKGSSVKPKNDFTFSEAQGGNLPDFYLQVIAPCNHHGECPLQLKTLEPYSYGGKLSKKINWCHFNSTVARPKFLMELKKGKLMGAEWDIENYGIASKGVASEGKGRSFSQDHETFSYSYLILQRTKMEQMEAHDDTESAIRPFGFSGENIDEWPRVMRAPLKKKGMVVAEVCGASGKLEKWIIPKSHGRQIYHDARKLQQGDLWPSGAKTKAESSRNAYKLLERIETKEANIRKKEKMDKKQEKRMQRRMIEMKQIELQNMEPTEDNLVERIENMGLQMELKMKDNPKVRKIKQGKYKF